MANNYSVAKQRARITATAAGALYQDVQKVDLAALALGTVAIGDTIQVGVVPAGHVLVPELSGFTTDQIDANGTPTGTFSLGIAGSAAGLLAATAFGATVTKAPGALLSAAVGSETADVPILLTATAAVATAATTGVFTGKWVLRAFDPAVDA